MGIILESFERTNAKRMALEYLEHGFSVIPVALDGSKRPKISWKAYQQQPPTSSQVEQWFSQPCGIGLVTGVVSGGFEVLDFDTPEIAPAWFHIIPEDLRERLVVVQTGSGGFQVYYRCQVVSANSKIALEPYSRLAADEHGNPKENDQGRHYHERGVDVRVETRGEGGYVVAVGSPAAVHLSGRPYSHVTGPKLPKVQRITPEERRLLWIAASEFDLRSNPYEEYVQKRVRELVRKPSASRDEDAPWERFNRLARWEAILSPHGWKSDDGIHWRRPGKAFGHSAIIRNTEDGNQVLVVFSTSSEIGPEASSEHRTLGKFEAWKQLEFGGDGKEAARKARQLVGGAK